MSQSTAKRVWIAMAEAERAHGGPLTMTSSDIWDRIEPRTTTPTINRALRELQHYGLVRIMPGRPNGYRLWQLDAPGRAKYGLPNSHPSRPSTAKP